MHFNFILLLFFLLCAQIAYGDFFNFDFEAKLAIIEKSLIYVIVDKLKKAWYLINIIVKRSLAVRHNNAEKWNINKLNNNANV